MIISHKHKFIYFKSCKAAGTSIEVFLSAYCGEEDIITNIGEKTAAWHVSRNAGIYHKHSFASEVQQVMANKQKFNDYFKFTSVRHPIDKMLSLYYWWKDSRDFNGFVAGRGFPLRATFFHPFYMIGGTIITDDLIRQETLSADLQRICAALGIEYDEKYLLHYKKRERSMVQIDDNTLELIKKKFHREYKDLGYADFTDTEHGVHTYPENWRAEHI